MARAIKAIWLSLALACLALVLVARSVEGIPDLRMDGVWEGGLLLLMSLLSFPSSIPLFFLGAWAFWYLIGDTDALYFRDAGIVVAWLILFGGGYAQWFVLVPRLWRKRKARRTGALQSETVPTLARRHKSNC